jgi:hypothetical protein
MLNFAQQYCHCWLTHLTGASDEGHLPMFLQVILQHGGVEAGAFTHATIIACIVKQYRPFYDWRDNGSDGRQTILKPLLSPILIK